MVTPAADNLALEQLRAARDALYENMKGEPAASIPWGVHELLLKMDKVLGAADVQKTTTAMERLVAGDEEASTRRKIISFLLRSPDVTIQYSDILSNFPGEDPKYLRVILSEVKRGEIKLVSEDGAVYKASGERGEIMVTKAQAGPETAVTPAGLKPRSREDRALLYLHNNPDASDANIAGYSGMAEGDVKSALSRLRARGYLEKGSRTLTKSGTEAARRLGSGKKPEPLTNRLRSYFAGKEGQEVGREEFYTAFQGENRSSLLNYWRWFSDGKHGYTIDGFSIVPIGDNRIRVEKSVAAGSPASGNQPAAQGGNGKYAPNVESIEQIYSECPDLKDMIGNRTGLEPRVLEARRKVRPGKVGDFYETLRRIPLEGSYFGRGHNQFLVLAARDERAAGEFMSWAVKSSGLTSEAVYDELKKYEPGHTA